MAFSLVQRITTARCFYSLRARPVNLLFPSYVAQRRTFLNFFRRKKSEEPEPAEPISLLSEDDLFHPFSKSPFPQVRARGETISSMAPCPVCASEHSHTLGHAHQKPLVKKVVFECPDCGWPTHCSEEHWKEDKEHEIYCSRLREANEDEHDLRSGRRMPEFELPGPQGYEEAISFANWDTFWYTRGFNSMDSERSRRHASKLLSYPMTIGSVLHEHSSLMLNNQRLTPEGSRSMAAIRSTLHTETGAPETHEASVGKPQVRIFILGARGESSLPPHVWEQLGFLFPAANFHVLFIGPQVALPLEKSPPAAQSEDTSQSSSLASDPTPSSESSLENETLSQEPRPSELETKKPLYTPNVVKEDKPSYTPNVYTPPTPPAIPPLKWTRSSLARYGVPSYTTPYSYQMSLSGLQVENYADVHPLFEETLDPYSDVFFFFSPGFGFPSPISKDENGKALLQISSPTEWGPVLPLLLASKCPIFVTGFSPADVERDVRSLSTAPGIANEFEWVITPGPNPFGSEKWEVADFDPRITVKTNWGIWAIRGKSRDIQERSFFSNLFTRN